MKPVYQSLVPTPIGTLSVLANHDAITRINFVTEDAAADFPETELTRTASQQLNEYFAHQRRTFDLPLAPAGTDFQQSCWQALQTIPFGETRYYGQQATLVQRPTAVRAVGAANRANPLSIVVPCHRVIGKNGQLTGYAGGLDRKSWLLELEQGL